jgi:hypothetical protein
MIHVTLIPLDRFRPGGISHVPLIYLPTDGIQTAELPGWFQVGALRPNRS